MTGIIATLQMAHGEKMTMDKNKLSEPSKLLEIGVQLIILLPLWIIACCVALAIGLKFILWVLHL